MRRQGAGWMCCSPIRFATATHRRSKSCWRRRGQAFRSSDELVGLESATFTGVASRETGVDRDAARRAQKRAGGGSVPPRTVRCQRGLAPAQRADTQRAVGDATAGLAAGVAAGAAEAAAFFGMHAAGQIRESCAAAQAAVDARLETFFKLGVGVGAVAVAGARRLATAFSLLLLARRNCARARACVPELASAGRRATLPGMPSRPASRGGSPPRARSPSRKTPSAPPTHSRTLLRTDYGPARTRRYRPRCAMV